MTNPDNSPRARILRMLLMLDATVLAVFGVLLICCPLQITAAFQFKDVPAPIVFLLGFWGCALFSLAAGSAVAAIDPVRHRLWIGMTALRAVLEALFGLWCLQRELVTWKQSGLGILLAAFIALAFIVFYPRQPRDDSWKLSV